MIETLIRRFYSEFWEQGNEARAAEILHMDLRFRGSVGLEKDGIEGFLGYLRLLRGALADYRCNILSLVASGESAAARMRFHGVHVGEFLGVRATGQKIEWSGAAFFELRGKRLIDIWVLGDTDALRRQLEHAS